MLSGKGTKNKCSKALEDRIITTDQATSTNARCSRTPSSSSGGTRGTGHGGNYDGDDENTAWVTPLLDAALAAAAAPAAPAHVGSVQIIRYRAAGCKTLIQEDPPERAVVLQGRDQVRCARGVGRQRGERGGPQAPERAVEGPRDAARGPYEALAEADRARGDSLHMHVDQDKRASNVILLALGDTRRMASVAATCIHGRTRLTVICTQPARLLRQGPRARRGPRRRPKGLAKDRALDRAQRGQGRVAHRGLQVVRRVRLQIGRRAREDGSRRPTWPTASLFATSPGPVPAELPDWAKSSAVSPSIASDVSRYTKC